MDLRSSEAVGPGVEGDPPGDVESSGIPVFRVALDETGAESGTLSERYPTGWSLPLWIALLNKVLAVPKAMTKPVCVAA